MSTAIRHASAKLTRRQVSVLTATLTHAAVLALALAWLKALPPTPRPVIEKVEAVRYPHLPADGRSGEAGRRADPSPAKPKAPRPAKPKTPVEVPAIVPDLPAVRDATTETHAPDELPGSPGGAIDGDDVAGGGAGEDGSGDGGGGDGTSEGPGGGGADEAIRMRADVVRPELLYKVNPEYPRIDQRFGAHGSRHLVVLECIVGKDGSVSVQEVKTGKESFAEAAREAVEQWRYRPATVDGRPVAVFLTVRIWFSID